jgi:hypothetical protein
MHVPINVKSPNNISKWQMGFNSAFKGLRFIVFVATVNAEYNELFVNFVCNGGNSDDRVIKNTTFTIN